MARGSARLVPLVLSILAAGLCGCGNGQAGALQTPAVISGVVTSRPSCPSQPPPGACSNLVALVPGARVQATGKDGTHQVRADAKGHYQLSLLEGVWDLQASRPAGAAGAAGSAAAAPVQIEVQAGRARTVNLQVSG